jgi:ABC-type Fe3+/spermidine/putrescine transport system ATPase subunit
MNGKTINDVPTHKRGVGMVFQSYALFPHLTVFENVAFGLRLRNVNKEERLAKTHDLLELVLLKDLSQRYPHELSGGQQQRVALARSLITNPDVLLLDEPLSNLDLKLREQMRLEIIRIQKQFKITSIYVTHDQGEALAMSNRIVVMNQGLIEQIGTPGEIYRYPKTRFVADFIGQSNFWKGGLSLEEGLPVFVTKEGLRLRIAEPDVSPGSNRLLLIRPEAVEIGRDLSGDNGFKATIEEMIYQGDTTRYYLRVEQREKLIVNRQSERGTVRFVPGTQVLCQIRPEDCLLIEG